VWCGTGGTCDCSTEEREERREERREKREKTSFE